MKRHVFVPAFLSILLIPLVWWGIPLLENSPESPGGNIELHSNDKPWSLNKNLGKFTFVYFGYTRCPDVCPTTLYQLKNILLKMPKELSNQIQVVFVSVDHKSDTSVSVAEYAQNIHPNFVGVTGSKDEVDQVVKKFQTTYEFQKMKDSKLSYSVIHSNRIYLLDKSGKYLSSFFLEDQNAQTLSKTLRNQI